MVRPFNTTLSFLVLVGVCWSLPALAAEGPKDPFGRIYKVTEEANAPRLVLESANPDISPSQDIQAYLKPNRVTYFLMCNGPCGHLRDSLRHLAQWVARYGEFGVKAHAFLWNEDGDWPQLDTLKKDFGQEVAFYTKKEITNLEKLMQTYEVDLSPVIFVSTGTGFLMGRMTGYSPKDLLEWNDYFKDMFRPLIRKQLNTAPGSPEKEKEIDEW